MARDNPISRRTALKLTGATAAATMVAGCGGGGNSGGNGSGSGGENSYDIEPGTTIEFEATTSDWTGIAPSQIEGESNPTLNLQAGEDYTIGWTEGDGNEHNIEIWDDSGTVVNELSTDQVSEPENQMLEFTASSEMAQYVCQPHSTNMVGDLNVEGSNGGGNETSGNETSGNETSGNETSGNETSGNETSGNETSGNESGE